MLNPLKQFEVFRLFQFGIFGADFSLTNSALWMIIVSIIIVFFALFVQKEVKSQKTSIEGYKVTRFLAVTELIYEAIENMVGGTIGEKGRKYLPLIFTLFTFILMCNLLGMLPGAFTVTSSIAVTFCIASSIFIFITLLAIYKHGVRFLSLFLPEGTPALLLPLMFVIELFAYLARPISLSLRLTANMVAGHIVIKTIASLVILSGLVFGIFPLSLLVVLTGFEFFIAILQAYIFTILSCVYLNDALNLH